MASIENPVSVTETKTTGRTYQTGHAKNVSNFESLIIFVEGYGAVYNPGKELLKLESLNQLKEIAILKLNEVNVTLSAYTHTVTERETAFEGIDTYVTNMYLQLRAYEPSKNVLADMQSYIRKFKGRRAVPKITLTELEKLSETESEVKYNSVAQLGYDSRVENLDRIIALLATIPSYQPNEAEYKLQGLQDKLTVLRDKNSKVTQATADLSNKRKDRNEVLYNSETGLYDVALGVKSYVRAVFGLNSPQYKQIKNLRFTLK